MALNEQTQAIRDDARHVRESLSTEKLGERLEEAVEERPALGPFLEPRPLLTALGIAAVLTLLAALVLGVKIAALVLVLSFGIAWVSLSKRAYEVRRPTADADDEDADGDEAKRRKDVTPFSG